MFAFIVNLGYHIWSRNLCCKFMLACIFGLSDSNWRSESFNHNSKLKHRCENAKNVLVSGAAVLTHICDYVCLYCESWIPHMVQKLVLQIHVSMHIWTV